MATRAYFSSSNYLKQMSDYPGAKNWEDRWNSVYYKFINDNFPNAKVSIWGRSLGAGVATQVAFHTTYPYRNLVLVTPWANVYKLCHQRMGVGHGQSGQPSVL